MKKVKKQIYNNYILYIELFCSLCCFNNNHSNEHKLIDINDKDSLEKNNISYNKFNSEFDNLTEKIKNIKQRIEEEIQAINDTHKKMTDEIVESFKKQHLQLDEKEKLLKLEMDLNVTEVKEDLEKYLIESNNIMLSCERTLKIIKNYEKKNNNNIIKTLCYISKINDTNEKSKNLIQTPIKNLDISLNENNTLNYKHYYFNGNPIPKNIKIEDKNNKIEINWEINDLSIKDFDMKKIKYSIQIKVKDKYLNYETSERYLILDKNEVNVDYAVNIRALIDGLCGNWSEIKKFKIEKPNKNEGIFNNNLLAANNPYLKNNDRGSLFTNNNHNNSFSSLFNNKNTGGLFNFQ